MSIKDWRKREQERIRRLGPPLVTAGDARRAWSQPACRCGKRKRIGQPLCLEHFRALPEDLRRRLAGVGEDRIAAYLEAVRRIWRVRILGESE